jgi:hypothetical protein
MLSSGLREALLVDDKLPKDHVRQVSLEAPHGLLGVATIALKRRLAKLGPEHQPAVREVGDYQKMVKGYWEAFRETADMHSSGT